MMNPVRSFLAVAGVAVSLLASTSALAKDCDVNTEKQECCSAKSCGGKVLSNRDAHNCSDKSKGKSWHAAATPGHAATCTNL